MRGKNGIIHTMNNRDKTALTEGSPTILSKEIFMAIAEDIGFDATGKPTKVNELDEIGVALVDFIQKEAAK